MMNNKEEKYIFIRGLLDLYYQGVSTPEETDRLYELLTQAEDLPSDLEADRELLLAVGKSVSIPVDLPQDIDCKILESLEEEMRLSRASEALDRARSVSRRMWQQRMLAFVAAAACLLLGVVAVSVIGRRGVDTPSSQTAHFDNKTEKTISEGSFTSDQTIATSPEEAPESQAESRRVAESLATARSKSSKKVGLQKPEVTNDGYALEEERMARADYHVVTDEREAYAIMNSIFSRLENRSAEGAQLVNGIVEDDQYSAAIPAILDI